MARVQTASAGTLLDAVRRGRAVQRTALPELAELGRHMGGRLASALTQQDVFAPLEEFIGDSVAACAAERIPEQSGETKLGGIPATLTLHPMGLLEIGFVLTDEPLFGRGANRAELLDVANAVGSLNTTQLGAQLVELRTLLASPHVDVADAAKLRLGLHAGLWADTGAFDKLAAASVSVRATPTGVTCSIGSVDMGAALRARAGGTAAGSRAARAVHPAAGALLWSILWPGHTSAAFRFWGFQPRKDGDPKSEHAHLSGASVCAGRFNVGFAKDGSGDAIDEATLLALLPFSAKRPPEGFDGGERGATELAAARYQTLWDPGPSNVRRDRFLDRRDEARAPLRRGEEWAFWTESFGWVLGRGLTRTWSESEIDRTEVSARQSALPWTATTPARRK